MADRNLPDDPISFIKGCIRNKRIFWTYHVNMRMKTRFISREMILESVEKYELIESYPEDKYLPSYLIYSCLDDIVFHAVFAVDQAGMNIRIVSAYRPDPAQWESDLKTRKR